MSVFVTGTGTGVGKTHTAAALLSRYASSRIRYWKPVQTGPDSDSAAVQDMTALPGSRFVPTGWSFLEPLSPHRAAELEERSVSVLEIDRAWGEHEQKTPLIVEGAGGILVPLNRKETWIDLLAARRCPVIIAASSGLGTINHSLLTIRALKESGVQILGIFFNGPRNDDNMRTILDFSGITSLGWLDFRGRLADAPGEIDPGGVLGRLFA